MAKNNLKFDESNKVWCIVTQPDSVCFSFKLKEDAKGQDLLDAVCERLNIVEKDYFGFQYTNRGENLWLNMRNRILRQLPSKPEPFSLLFCVKFYVQPHLLLQESTRHQFFLNVKRDFQIGKYRPDRKQSVRVQALIGQALSGDFRENHIAYNPPRSAEWPVEYRSEVIMEHCRLRGIPTESAEYQFLTEIATLEEYGMEHTSVKTEDNSSVVVGVGTECLKIHRIQDNLVDRVPYTCLRMATHSGKCVKLDIYANDLGDIETVTYRLNSKESACALYRSITEHHAFYRCDSIRPAVKKQVSKDLFDTLRSWFWDEDTAEQNYIFDTERTCREAHDHARRVLYNFGSVTAVALEKTDNREQKVTEQDGADLKEKYSSIQESFRCRVCRDNPINTVNIQCGHIVCCSDCIKLCSTCPLCRTPIETLTPVFLPVELDFESDQF